MKLRSFAYCLIAILALVSLSLAGDRSNIRGVGMARTFIVDSRSVDALGINPANLALDDRLPFTLALPSFGIRVSSELINYDAYNKYFTGVPDPQNPGHRIQDPNGLSPQDKNDLLSLLPDNGSTRADVEVTWLGLSIQLGRVGSLGFDITDHIGTRLDIPKSYFKVFLFGLDSSGSNYNFNGTSASAWSWREMNFSYANRLPLDLPFMHDVRFGVGVKVELGYGAMVTDHYNASIANNVVGGNQYQIQAAFDFLTRRAGTNVFGTDSANKPKFYSQQLIDSKFFPHPAGTGLGFDFGLNGEVMDGFRLGVSVTDIGKISWDQNLVETYGAYSLSVTDPFNLPAQDSLRNGFKGYNRPGQPFVTALPTKFRIGAAFETGKMPVLHYLPGNMLMEIDYNQGLNESMGNSTIPRVSIGTEWRLIPFLPLRTGISLGGGDQFRWAFGFGLDIWVMSLDVGTENFGMLFSPKSFSMFSAGAGLRIRL